MSRVRVAVLGAGMQGVCTALELARRGVAVELFDQDDTAVNRASLRNEGKIHLGFVYANDPTSSTANLMLEGALRFRRLLDRWTHGGFASIPTSHPFNYLVAGNSLVGTERLREHYEKVQQRYRERTTEDAGLDYLGGRPALIVRPLTRGELRATSPETVVAGFATAEVAIHLPTAVALLRDAMTASSVRFHKRRRIRAVQRSTSGFRVDGTGPDGTWSLGCDQVVNTLWDGRLAVDATMGLVPDRPWIYRLKYRVLVRLPKVLRASASASLVLGPYGDVVVHPGGTGYVSWYPGCMRAWSEELAPPASWDAACRGILDAADASDIARRAFNGADPWFPGIAAAEPFTVDAGVIFAFGRTDIDDPSSELHRRDTIGVRSCDGYHTVNTGKLTTAPMFAVDAADRVTATRDLPHHPWS
ncbi:MAG: FAD-dependent oxidoreductase [Acidimicrobiia bacterium]